MAGDDDFFAGLDDAEPGPAPDSAPAPEAPAAAAAPAAPAAAPTAPAAAEPASAKPPEAAASEAPKAPAPAAAPVADRAAAPDPSKWVPVGAHVDLRRQLQAAHEEIQKLKNPPAPPTPPPNYEQDPKGYVDQTVKAALDKLEAGQKTVTQTAQQAVVAATETQVRQSLALSEQQFALAHPDYQDALNHLRTQRIGEIVMLNPEVTKEQVQQMVLAEEWSLAQNLMRAGRNPSEVAYQFAKTRGYVPKTAPPAATPAAAAPVPTSAQVLLPEVPQPKQLAPDLTLGTGTGAPAVPESITSDDDMFNQAWSEMFGRKRA